MKCFRCHKEIAEEGKYFIMIGMNNKQEEGRTYVHETCWNEFIKQTSSVEESMGIIRGLKKYFINQGVLPGEEYTVQ